MMREASIIERIERHIDKAKKIVKLDSSDEIIFNALAMHCFQAINAGIELGELIISAKKLGFPSKYREIFELIFKAKLISKNTFQDIERLVYLRNLVAHEYQEISAKELKEMANLLASSGVSALPTPGVLVKPVLIAHIGS